MSLKLQIPQGTLVGQDFSFWYWPGEYGNHVDDTFEAILEGGHVVCRATGFGVKGAYGNGAIYISVGHLFQQPERREG